MKLTPHHLKGFLPVEFGQSRAKSSNRISLSQFMVRVWILNICVRLSISGRPNSTLRSNRPGRNNAGSSVSGLKNVANEVHNISKCIVKLVYTPKERLPVLFQNRKTRLTKS